MEFLYIYFNYDTKSEWVVNEQVRLQIKSLALSQHTLSLFLPGDFEPSVAEPTKKILCGFVVVLSSNFFLCINRLLSVSVADDSDNN